MLEAPIVEGQIDMPARPTPDPQAVAKVMNAQSKATTNLPSIATSQTGHLITFDEGGMDEGNFWIYGNKLEVIH